MPLSSLFFFILGATSFLNDSFSQIRILRLFFLTGFLRGFKVLYFISWLTLYEMFLGLFSEILKTLYTSSLSTDEYEVIDLNTL